MIFVNVAKRTCDQCLIFSMVQQFCPDYGLYALTQVARCCSTIQLTTLTAKFTLGIMGFNEYT